MKRTFSLLALVSLLLLTACLATTPPPGPLRLSGASYQSTDDDQLAVAVDASGRKHIARAECRTDTGKSCRIIYQSTHVGEQGAYQVWTPVTGYTFRNPDIAVTNSGLAFVTWQNCPDDNPSTRLCSTWFLRSDNDLGAYVLDIGTHSLSAPVVVSRGEVVYAVHEVTVGTASSALRFCKISDPEYDCFWASDHADTGLPRSAIAAAVSGYGSLHVAWLYGDGTSRIAYSSDNYAAQNADMSILLNMGTANYLPPVVAIETDNTYVYYALATNELASDRMTLYYCAPTNCSTNGGVKVINLPEEKAWSIYGKPSITAGSAWALVGFSAITTDHSSQSEVYYFTYPAGGTETAVTRPYPTNLGDGNNDCDPVVALVDGWITIGWHICGFPPARDDVYIYDYINGGRIVHASAWAGRGGLDLAANGEYVAGIWNELQGDGRIATWLAFNSHMTWLPVIKK